MGKVVGAVRKGTRYFSQPNCASEFSFVDHMLGVLHLLFLGLHSEKNMKGVPA